MATDSRPPVLLEDELELETTTYPRIETAEVSVDDYDYDLTANFTTSEGYHVEDRSTISTISVSKILNIYRELYKNLNCMMIRPRQQISVMKIGLVFSIKNLN